MISLCSLIYQSLCPTPQEEELDCQQGVIDFSLYLRASPTEESCEPSAAAQDMSESKYERVLDQKNYIEELNRHLKSVTQAAVQRQRRATAILSDFSPLAVTRFCLRAAARLMDADCDRRITQALMRDCTYFSVIP